MYLCQVVSTFAALIFTTGRVTTEWGMSPTDPKICAGSTHRNEVPFPNIREAGQLPIVRLYSPIQIPKQ